MAHQTKRPRSGIAWITARMVEVGERGQSVAEVGSVGRYPVELAADVRPLLAGLSDTEREVISLRFGLDHARQRAPDEVARILGLSVERIRARQ